MSTELHTVIREYILENYLFTDEESAIGLDDSLLGEGIVDSNGMLDIILFLEEELGVAVEDHEMVPENLDSVNRLAGFVARKKAAAA